MKKLSFFNKFVFVINLITGLLLLLACMVPYSTSASFSFLSLGVPLLVILNIVFFIYWLTKGKYILWFSIVILIIGYVSLGSFVQFKLDKDSIDDNQLKVMTYNAFGFGGYGSSNSSKASKKIANFIETENPDIISFQEYSQRINRTEVKDDYPYQYVNGGYSSNENRVIQAIYSKYPIINEGVLEFPESANHAIYADIALESDTVRVYNLHLESLNIRPGMVKRERSDRLFKRLRNSFAKQHEQALIFRKNAENCSYAKIVCVDLNNTQFSSAYRIIKGNMNDSFAEEGTGYGKTIYFWRFPFRIDFILADLELEVLSHKNYNIGLSDHEPVMASFKLSSKE
ncbi:endonuclease/exonuclease/phosphatase family protein [Maribacter aestuarii]|uniref:endonuclease/exonuclease/phosphatase family protein n=1 Tax=Maribacter aestuarii TaxID=1130723 RepID=UPI00248B4C5F|nr:endonuclease/exonuclease/phosphatase family protein [Maribacter aestuarii]